MEKDALTAFLESLQPLCLDTLPGQLKRGRQHVVWKPELRRDQKIGKPPYHPRGYRASSKKPASWGTYSEAVHAYQQGGYAGIGYMLTKGILFVDLDHCRIPTTGVLSEEAQEVMRQLDSYAEASPTGTGIHIYLLGTLDLPAHRFSYHGLHIEVYQTDRYTTLTGVHLPETPALLQPRTDALRDLLQIWQQEEEDTPALPAAPQPTRVRVAPYSRSAPTGAARPHRPDEEVLRRARQARNGATFETLWNGDDPKGRNDKSEADFDLVLLLLYWTNDDEAQTARLYRQSGRYDEKTDRPTTHGGATYLDLTIYNALRKRGRLTS
jgi:primase-polymerase (primpol)-like protein